MSVETKPTETLENPAVAPANPQRPRLRRSHWLLILACGLFFVGLLALALLTINASVAPVTLTATPPAPNGTPPAAFVAARQINALVADPADYQNLFAATDKGVVTSSDGGQSWNDVSSGLTATNITTLALDGSDPTRPLYAGTQSAGLFKSSDGGQSWNNLGLTGRDIVALAAYQGRVYVGVRGQFAGLYHSSDSGQTFAPATSGQLPPQLDIRSIAVDPVNPDLVYMGTAPASGLHFSDFGRVKFSSDAGKSWRDLGRWSSAAGPNNDAPQLNSQASVNVLLAISSSRVYAGNGGALFRLSPDQTVWQAVAEGLPQSGVLDVTSDPQVPTVVYAITTDGFYRNSDGQKWVKISEAKSVPLLPDGPGALSSPSLIAANTHNNAISVNNLNSTFLYALGTDGGLSSYENRDFGGGELAALPGGPPLPDFSAYGGINPADPLEAPTIAGDTSREYYKETGHFISTGFLTYWKQNGGLGTFGFPLTEEFAEFDATHNITLTVQYFERAKFEYHPELPANGRIQIGLIGREATAGKYYVPGRYIPTTSTQNYFSATNHTLSGVFYQYWAKNGALGRFGLPLTEEVTETQADGRKLMVQYFERAKLEYQPDSTGKPGPVQIGLLGRQVLVQKGWLKK